MISTHAPLAGRDIPFRRHSRRGLLISTHAPLAGRDGKGFLCLRQVKISTHAPLAGRDFIFSSSACVAFYFNPRAPCGARPSKYPCMHRDKYFNPRAPCGARLTQSKLSDLQAEFQPTRPLRGATHAEHARRLMVVISTHAPLAGRDRKRVQITMHIFAITDKFQMLLHRMPPVRAFCSFLMQENHADFGCEPPK